MIKYNLVPPVVIDKIQNLPEIIGDSYESVLVLTSPTLYKYVDSIGVFENLKINNTLSIISDIRPNAPINKLDEIISTCKKPSIIVAIGGGSVIDSAKALSVCWSGKSVSEYFNNQKELTNDKIELIAIPTTAGTGAELSYGAILEDTVNKIKGGIRGEIVQPNKVLVDFNLYSIAPSKLKAEVGFDCLTHAIETYISIKSSPIVKYQSIAAIQNIFDHLTKAVENNDKALQKIVLASLLMGINLAKSSTCLPHRIQYIIGPITDTSHAQGLIMLYRGWLPVISKEPVFKELANDLGYNTQEFIGKIEQLKKDLGIDYSLADYGISKSESANLAMQVTGAVDMDPCYKNVETIEYIITGSI